MNNNTRKDKNTILSINSKDSNIKLFAVADYVNKGSLDSHETSYVIDCLDEWFNNFDEKHYKDYHVISNELKQQINKINSCLYGKISSSENNNIISLTTALVLNDKTVVLTVGNSRTYALKDFNLEQISNDQSVGWNYYTRGLITKEQLRESKHDKNKVTNALGYAEVTFDSPDIKIIDNNEYDTLLLFNNGITDLLSDEKIQIISKNTDRIYLSDKLIEEAKKEDSKKETLSVVYSKK